MSELNKNTKKLLIVNADDFGLNKNINKGIINAFKNGIVRSTSLIPVGKAFNDAVDLAKAHPELDVGIHLTLTQEKPVSNPEKIPSLVNKQGNLFSLPDFLFKYFCNKIKKKDINLELKAQFKKALNSGLKLTHVDSHNHLHILPSILDITIELCSEFNIRCIRVPSEKTPLKHLLLNASPKKIFIVYGIKFFTIGAKYKIEKKILFSPDFFYGIFNSGCLKTSDIENLSVSLKEGISELMVHPGLIGLDLIANYGSWNYNWEEELSVLTKEQIKTLLKASHITLTNFKNINKKKFYD